jgi:hypothetical protein
MKMNIYHLTLAAGMRGVGGMSLNAHCTKYVCSLGINSTQSIVSPEVCWAMAMKVRSQSLERNKGSDEQ